MRIAKSKVTCMSMASWGKRIGLEQACCVSSAIK